MNLGIATIRPKHFCLQRFFFWNKRVGKQKHMARYRGHSYAINFTEDQLNFRSIINAQIEIELLIDETKFSKAKSANRQENRRIQFEIVKLEE